ncbi:MAG TPA: AtpZ/AtpI family protein [Terriglobales bacterium]
MPSDQQPPENQKGEDKGNTPPQKTNWVEVSNYAELAIMFPAATVIGWLIGVGLDKWLHTTWLYIVGLLLGIGAGFVQLIRTASKNT